MTDGPYRDGRVHVLVEQCPTCIFRPGNPMRLRTGRVREMVRCALKSDTAITCHDTLYRDDVQPAICRGFFERYSTQPLQVAERLGYIDFDPVPERFQNV